MNKRTISVIIILIFLISLNNSAFSDSIPEIQWKSGYPYIQIDSRTWKSISGLTAVINGHQYSYEMDDDNYANGKLFKDGRVVRLYLYENGIHKEINIVSNNNSGIEKLKEIKTDINTFSQKNKAQINELIEVYGKSQILTSILGGDLDKKGIICVNNKYFVSQHNISSTSLNFINEYAIYLNMQNNNVNFNQLKEKLKNTKTLKKIQDNNAILISPTDTVNTNQAMQTVSLKEKDRQSDNDSSKNQVSGCISGDCINGDGIYIFEKNIKYEGQFKEAKKHGQGTQYYPNGQKRYEGEFKEGYSDGFGTMYAPHGIKIYEGQFKNDEQNGIGTYFFEESGYRYEGQFKDGLIHGQGILYNKNGQKDYEGEHKYGRPDGQGIKYYENGAKLYEGQFKDGLSHGQGIMYNENGQKDYEGKWIKSLPDFLFKEVFGNKK